MTRVLILGGGPDAERDISIASATAVHRACLDAGLDAQLLIIDEPTIDEIKLWDAQVIFPVLHGPFGEGGVLQARLEQAGCPFVGSRSTPSRLAMDKMGTKDLARHHAIPTPDAAIFDPTSSTCPLELPVVIKPIADGSSVGLHLCTDQPSWEKGIEQARADIDAHQDRSSMIEQMIIGRELTVSVISNEQGELVALPIIEIAPAAGVYDFEAKYARSDTVYTPNPDLADDITTGMKAHALSICSALGVRHLGRVDFLLDEHEQWFMLEVNTMPGFTATSLMPMAALANGMDMPTLCAHLVRCAMISHQHAQTTH